MYVYHETKLHRCPLLVMVHSIRPCMYVSSIPSFLSSCMISFMWSNLALGCTKFRDFLHSTHFTHSTNITHITFFLHLHHLFPTRKIKGVRKPTHPQMIVPKLLPIIFLQWHTRWGRCPRSTCTTTIFTCTFIRGRHGRGSGGRTGGTCRIQT